MTKKQWIALWIAERDAVVKTYDVQKFKIFYEKWRARGMYSLKLPSDEVIEVSLRKMVYNMTTATKAEKKEAKEWLESRHYSTSMYDVGGEL